MPDDSDALCKRERFKALDFGLAKTVEPVSEVESDFRNSPTLNLEAATRAGVVLGVNAVNLRPRTNAGHNAAEPLGVA